MKPAHKTMPLEQCVFLILNSSRGKNMGEENWEEDREVDGGVGRPGRRRDMGSSAGELELGRGRVEFESEMEGRMEDIHFDFLYTSQH